MSAFTLVDQGSPGWPPETTTLSISPIGNSNPSKIGRRPTTAAERWSIYTMTC